MKKKRSLLISLRNQKGVTQKEIVSLLKEQFSIEISESYYGMIEQGVRTPKLDTALAISKLFDVNPEEIFFKCEHNKNLGNNTQPA